MNANNKINKIWMRRMPFMICAFLICILIGVILFMDLYTSASDIEFIYQGKVESSAQQKQLCNTTGWGAVDVGLKTLDQGSDVSEDVQEVLTQTDLGMDITYTWKNESFTLHVSNPEYTPPVFQGTKEIKVNQGDTLAKNISAYDIQAKDFCGKDISDRIEFVSRIDTNTIGSQETMLVVKDDFQHESEYPVTFIVEEAQFSQKDIIYNNGIADPLSIVPQIVSNPEKIDVLVNKFHALPDEWVPNDLVNITSNNDRKMQLRQEAASAFERMNAAALQDDITIRVISGYRSKDYQQTLFNNYYNDDPIYAYKYSAVPRRSEHETGLAIDVSYDSTLYTDLHTSDLGKWMDAHAHEYGFMLRFLEGKETITNYAFEPWHYRYVGIDIATKIKTSGLTMEEYYSKK